MKKSALAFAASVLVAGTAQAAIVTVEYSVPVAWIAEEYLDPYSYEEVGNTFLGGIQTYVGDPLTGRFTYDDAAALVPGFGGYYTQVLSHSLTFTLSDTTVTLDNSRLTTSRSATADGFSVSGNGYIGGETDPLLVVDFSFLAPPGTHGPETLPTAADWQHYAADAANPLRISIHGNGYNVYLRGGELSYSVSAVPEPATVAMTLAGLAIVGVAARRRKAAGA